MAVAFVNAGSMVHQAASPAASAFTITAGANCAFAVIAYDLAAGMSITAVTYNGVAMTSCGAASQNPTSNAYAEAWYLVNPPTGASHTLSITIAGTVTDVYFNLVSFSGVNTTTPVRAGTYFSTTTAQVLNGSGIYSATITSNANDLTLTVVNGGTNGLTGTNQTSDGNSPLGSYWGGSDHATTAATSVTHSWNGPTPGDNIALVGFSIDGDAVGGGANGDAAIALPILTQSGAGVGPAAPLFRLISVNTIHRRR